MLGEVSVVIPSIKEDVLTTESLPDHVETHVVGDPHTLNQARNVGVGRATNPIVAVMDDDIRFPPAFLQRCVDRVDRDTVVGVADWDYGLLAGRLLVFHKDLWDEIGGFDERLKSHMGDTDFAIKALEHGYGIERLPREVVYHDPHPRTNTAWDHAWRGCYLAGKHPRWAPALFRGMVA